MQYHNEIAAIKLKYSNDPVCSEAVKAVLKVFAQFSKEVAEKLEGTKPASKQTLINTMNSINTIYKAVALKENLSKEDKLDILETMETHLDFINTLKATLQS